jgi:hypothetical protein
MIDQPTNFGSTRKKKTLKMSGHSELCEYNPKLKKLPPDILY